MGLGKVNWQLVTLFDCSCFLLFGPCWKFHQLNFCIQPVILLAADHAVLCFPGWHV